jgi:hypothetical protein
MGGRTQEDDMGFSSYTCAKTNIPFAAGPDTHGGDVALSQVVILFADGPAFEGAYDGFGRIRGLGVHDMAGGKLRSQIAGGLAKVVLAAFHDPGTDTLDALGKNRSDPAQGVHEPSFLRACHAAGGFASYEGYVLAQEGIASPADASGLGRAAAQSVMATRTALCEAVSDIRMATLAEEGTAFAGNGRVYPHLLTIRPDPARPGTWVAAPDRVSAGLAGQPIPPALEEACRGVAFAIGDKPPGRREMRAAAARIVEAIPMLDEVRVPLVRDGEPAGEAVTRSCAMGSRWYEVRVTGERGLAFHGPAEAARALELEDPDALRRALWTFEGTPPEVELSQGRGFAP